ncbi:MAG: 2-oxoacid:ferredoxin oxidoreductase subunit beta [Candidatus Gottesmanbacteria bacterium]
MDDQFLTAIKPTWCPGCGNFGIWMALKNALTKLAIPRENIAIVYGVGCHGNMRDWMNVYGVEGLHGRALPVAQGIKLANPNLTVIAVTGDGDCLGEGGNHFIHAAKRNPNITVLVHNNEVYGLTAGQASPTAQVGMLTKSTPAGVVDPPFTPASLAVFTGATFVARGFAGDIPHLTELIGEAISHKGFSVVDMLQPCVTFDKIHTYQWYRERIQKVNISQENLGDTKQSLEYACTFGEKIPIGILHKRAENTSEDCEIVLKNGPLASLPVVSVDTLGILSQFQ